MTDNDKEVPTESTSAIAKYLNDLNESQSNATLATSSVQKLLQKAKDEFPDDGADVAEKTHLVKQTNLVEYDSQSSANMQLDMMKSLNHTISDENRSKSHMKHQLLKYFMWFFSIVTFLLFFVVIDPLHWGYSDTLKLALIGGFFTNLIALFIIIFKYVFSPSRETWDFWKIVRDGVRRDEKDE